jgi:hypothetical protein
VAPKKRVHDTGIFIAAACGPEGATIQESGSLDRYENIENTDGIGGSSEHVAFASTSRRRQDVMPRQLLKDLREKGSWEITGLGDFGQCHEFAFRLGNQKTQSCQGVFALSCQLHFLVVSVIVEKSGPS